MSKAKQDHSEGSVEELLVRHQLPDDSTFTPDTSLPHFFTVIANRASWLLQSMYSERYGLSVIGWRIIAILGKHAPLSAKSMSEMMATDAVTISRAIDQLGTKRLIRRRVDPADRRRQLLSLSKKGVETYNHVVPLLYAVEQSLLTSLCEEDQAHIRRLTRILVERSAQVISENTRWEDVLSAHGYGHGPETDTALSKNE